MKMLNDSNIKEITYNVVQFALKQLSDSGFSATSSDVISLSASISSSIIFNLINLVISKKSNESREEQRVYYAMTMWSLNKNIYKILETQGVEKGNFSIQYKKFE